VSIAFLAGPLMTGPGGDIGWVSPVPQCIRKPDRARPVQTLVRGTRKPACPSNTKERPRRSITPQGITLGGHPAADDAWVYLERGHVLPGAWALPDRPSPYMPAGRSSWTRTLDGTQGPGPDGRGDLRGANSRAPVRVRTMEAVLPLTRPRGRDPSPPPSSSSFEPSSASPRASPCVRRRAARSSPCASARAQPRG